MEEKKEPTGPQSFDEWFEKYNNRTGSSIFFNNYNKDRTRVGLIPLSTEDVAKKLWNVLIDKSEFSSELQDLKV